MKESELDEDSVSWSRLLKLLTGLGRRPRDLTGARSNLLA